MLSGHIDHSALLRLTMAGAMTAMGIIWARPAELLRRRCTPLHALGVRAEPRGRRARAARESVRASRPRASRGAYGRAAGVLSDRACRAGAGARRAVHRALRPDLSRPLGHGAAGLPTVSSRDRTARRAARAPLALYRTAAAAHRCDCCAPFLPRRRSHSIHRSGSKRSSRPLRCSYSARWRGAIANASALLLGIDPECEYAVDERVRVGRARNAAFLACAVGFVFIELAQVGLSPLYEAFGEVAYYVSIVAFLGAMAAYFLPLRARLRVA